MFDNYMCDYMYAELSSSDVLLRHVNEILIKNYIYTVSKGNAVILKQKK